MFFVFSNCLLFFFFFFFFNDTATTEIYTLSLHDALPIYTRSRCGFSPNTPQHAAGMRRSEEHTSELQSLRHLVCRLLLEKKKQKKNSNTKTQKQTKRKKTKKRKQNK